MAEAVIEVKKNIIWSTKEINDIVLRAFPEIDIKKSESKMKLFGGSKLFINLETVTKGIIQHKEREAAAERERGFPSQCGTMEAFMQTEAEMEWGHLSILNRLRNLGMEIIFLYHDDKFHALAEQFHIFDQNFIHPDIWSTSGKPYGPYVKSHIAEHDVTSRELSEVLQTFVKCFTHPEITSTPITPSPSKIFVIDHIATNLDSFIGPFTADEIVLIQYKK
ncbi:MAG: hypothetical protein Hyperionvirus1_64 [Hyperionvirus sp.]|uniref:Uncharacterized protein n=1 Tax=Hyperionvirus sp. TaxID=2487770 RepID=A0A3G5A5F8_9VIRU|nr:MAG: hypothetical protein Hyperionvirus1_64 [Hyperionvirus sp.]